MHELPAYRATIDASWIDYNGHLRDAYYGLVLSYAIDEMMEQIGLDAAYRERTRCTLYTLELHIHYLREVKASDALEVKTLVLDCDRKRIHAGCQFSCAGVDGYAAVAELMLLHVLQGERPASALFPADIAQRLGMLKLGAAAREAFGPVSRRIAIRRPA